MMVSGVRSRTQGMVLCALFAAMTAVLSQVAIPLPLVPINMALLAVYLSGGVLGARLGTLSQVVYVCLGAVGLPVFSLFRGGALPVVEQVPLHGPRRPLFQRRDGILL